MKEQPPSSPRTCLHPQDVFRAARIATRHAYRDSDDKPVYSETGTIADANSSALNPLRRTGLAYDAHRNPVRETLSSGGTTYAVTDRSFDDSGRLECSAVRMNPAAFGALPASACTLSAYDPALGYDRIARTYYDAAGQRTLVVEGLGTPDQGVEVQYTYTPNGEVMNVIDGNGNASRFDHDGHGRISHLWFPNPATPGEVSYSDYEAYYYDAAGNRTAVRRRDGRNIIYNYDSLDRVTSKIYPDGGATNVYYGYDLRDLQLSARFGSQSGEGISNIYDGFGRLASTGTDMGGITRTLRYRYDPAGNRTRITYPDPTDPAGRTFDYAYDALGRPVDLSAEGGSPILHADYAASGGIAALARRNPVGGATIASSDFVYDNVQRPSDLTHALSGSGVHWSYGRNAAGGISSIARDNDAYAWTGHYAVNRPYAVNGLNQYMSAGGAAFAYDARGNLTADADNGYSYDIENRLTSISGAHNATLAYDPLGRLYQVTGPSGTTTFLYDGDALVAEYEGATLLRRHVHSVGADVPLVTYEGADLSAPSHLFADHQGSIVALSNGAGALTNVNTYDEYGIPGAANSGRFQYTGQVWLAELGMYYYKARIYSPTLGRFLQTDPVGYQGGINLYGYVGDDPINHIDPTGTTCDGNREQGYTCHIDYERIEDSRGRLIRFVAVAPDDPRFATFNATYTAAVNQLAAQGNQNRSVTVDAVRGGRSFNTTVRAARESLVARKFIYSPRGLNRMGAVTGTRIRTSEPHAAMASSGLGPINEGQSYVAPSGLNSPARDIVHEGGIHSTPQELMGGLLNEDYPLHSLPHQGNIVGRLAVC